MLTRPLRVSRQRAFYRTLRQAWTAPDVRDGYMNSSITVGTYCSRCICVRRKSSSIRQWCSSDSGLLKILDAGELIATPLFSRHAHSQATAMTQFACSVLFTPVSTRTQYRRGRCLTPDGHRDDTACQLHPDQHAHRVLHPYRFSTFRFPPQGRSVTPCSSRHSPAAQARPGVCPTDQR